VANKSLDQLLGVAAATKLVAELRRQAEELFEAPGRDGLDELRDNIWDMYIGGGVEIDHPKAVVAAARRAYNAIFVEVAERRGFGKHAELRRLWMTRLSRQLADGVRGYKKVEPSTYVPTSDDLAKLSRATLSFDDAFVDLASQLVNLEELELYGSEERVAGVGKALAAALPAPKLRKLTLQETKPDVLDGAIANPAWAELEYLALYECNIGRAQLQAALARWPALATLALRPGRRLGGALLDIIATAAPRLEELALVDAELADDAIEALVLARAWPKLARVYLSGNELSAQTIKKVQKHLPKAKVSAK
jgi:hypothetical protein